MVFHVIYSPENGLAHEILNISSVVFDINVFSFPEEANLQLELHVFLGGILKFYFSIYFVKSESSHTPVLNANTCGCKMFLLIRGVPKMHFIINRNTKLKKYICSLFRLGKHYISQLFRETDLLSKFVFTEDHAEVW